MALTTSALVGSILLIINHADVLLIGESPPFYKICLTYCVPYVVATWGALSMKMRGNENNIQQLGSIHMSERCDYCGDEYTINHPHLHEACEECGARNPGPNCCIVEWCLECIASVANDDDPKC